MKQNYRHKREGETVYFCSDFPQTASPAAGSPWFELVAMKKIRLLELLPDFTAKLQLPTLCDMDSSHSFAGIYQEATMSETLCGGGCRGHRNGQNPVVALMELTVWKATD